MHTLRPLDLEQAESEPMPHCFSGAPRANGVGDADDVKLCYCQWRARG